MSSITDVILMSVYLLNMTYVPLSFCRFINARRKALQSEKERSAKVASLPPPNSNLIQVIRPHSNINDTPDKPAPFVGLVALHIYSPNTQTTLTMTQS